MIHINPLAIVAVFLFLLTGCSGNDDESTGMDRLRISVLPDQSESELRERFTPLLDYLSQETGLPYEFVLAKDYTDLLERFHRNELDLVRFGGFLFVKARLADGARPLAMRDVDARFTSDFVVKGDSEAVSIRDFKGKVFAFGSPLSTSGHLMPRYFLIEQGINPEEYFSEVRYSGAHDRTVEWVVNGQADLGVANAIVVSHLYQKGKINPEQVRSLWKTPHYADYVWAVSRRVPQAVYDRLLKAFLQLSPDKQEQGEILRAAGGQLYLPATEEDFHALEGVGRNLGLISNTNKSNGKN
jgi:phosphonate transport system substrate-binding protein